MKFYSKIIERHTWCNNRLHTFATFITSVKNNIYDKLDKLSNKLNGETDMLRDNNTKRNSAYYSIIDEEWDYEIKTGRIISG